MTYRKVIKLISNLGIHNRFSPRSTQVHTNQEETFRQIPVWNILQNTLPTFFKVTKNKESPRKCCSWRFLRNMQNKCNVAFWNTLGKCRKKGMETVDSVLTLWSKIVHYLQRIIDSTRLYQYRTDGKANKSPLQFLF